MATWLSKSSKNRFPSSCRKRNSPTKGTHNRNFALRGGSSHHSSDASASPAEVPTLVQQDALTHAGGLVDATESMDNSLVDTPDSGSNIERGYPRGIRTPRFGNHHSLRSRAQLRKPGRKIRRKLARRRRSSSRIKSEKNWSVNWLISEL